jgi:phosphoglucomutase
VSYTFFLYSSCICASRHAVSHICFAFSRSYTDPVDGSKATNQGLILSFEYPNGDPARVVFRLSGTGSAGATIRVYLERFEKDVAKHGMSAPVALKRLADRAVHLVKMKELTGRDSPTVIT